MRAILLALLIVSQSASGATDGLNADMSLDRASISKAYFEGDFDKVVKALETFRKAYPNPSREDKIYAYKYLSVIYAAKPETRAKAESFMYQLLKIMPSIELMDLYISDNIEAIFNSVRMRFEHQQQYAGKGAEASPGPKDIDPAPASSAAPIASAAPAAPGPARPDSAAARAGKKSGRSSWVWWTTAGVGVAAAVAGYVYLAADADPEPAERETINLE